MADPGVLPFETQVERTASGWSIRVPIRREFVSVTKQTVVAERVTVRRHALEHTEHLETTLQREQLRLKASDDALEVTRTSPAAGEVHHSPAPAAGEVHHNDTLAGSGLDQDPLG